MKKTTLLSGAVIITGLTLLASSAFASFGQGTSTGSFRGMGQGSGKSNSGAVSQNYQTFGVNMTREVKNITNGVEISMTSSDTATIEHMKAMFTKNSTKTPGNTLIKIERSQLTNGMKMTVTSTDPATIKQIQDNAASAKSGIFGKGGQGRGGMMGAGQGRGMRGGNNSQTRGNCLSNQ
ncbi:MAG: hypothetical protein PHS92_04650 [Candidatus Gracilibacteria bacterium]|nr:hypothetical protein [Candidatus Gracilibacteria bacterium]